MAKEKNSSLLSKVAELYEGGMCLQEIAASLNMRSTTLTAYFMDALNQQRIKFDASRPVGVTFGQTLNKTLADMLGINTPKSAILLLEPQNDGVLVRVSDVIKSAPSMKTEDQERDSYEKEEEANDSNEAFSDNIVGSHV